MEIDLRGRDAGVAHERLQGINVQPGLQHPCGERVPQGMPDHPVARIGDTIVKAELVHDAMHCTRQAERRAHHARLDQEKDNPKGYAAGVRAAWRAPRGKDAPHGGCVFFPPFVDRALSFAPVSTRMAPVSGSQLSQRKLRSSPGAQSRIQGEQNHVVDLHGLPTPPPVTKQLRDLCIAQDAESAAVHFGEHDSAIAAAQNRRIRAAEQHDAWSAWGWRLQCVIVDLPERF